MKHELTNYTNMLKHLTVVCLVIWYCRTIFASSLSEKIYGDIFIKSEVYAEENTVLATKITQSQQICLLLCATRDTCSMVLISPASGEIGERSHVCQIYQLENVTSFNKSHSVEREIWYKREMFFKMQTTTEIMPIEHVECPAAFTRVGSGCYHTSISPGNWNEAVDFCPPLEPGSHLAEFENVAVSSSFIQLKSAAI